MIQQIKVTTHDGFVKRLGDWDADKQELYIVLGREVFTLHLGNDKQFTLTETQQKERKN